MTLAPPKPTPLGLELLPEGIVDKMNAVLLKQVRSIDWKCAFASGLISGATFYSKLTGEMFRRPEFPRGGLPISIVSAKFGDAGIAVEYRIARRLPGARSYVIYDAARPEGMAFAGLIDDFAVDQPAYIGLTPTIYYSGPVLTCAIDKPNNSMTISVLAFPPAIFTPGASGGQRGYISDGIWWPLQK
jgi:hypothetical protein